MTAKYALLAAALRSLGMPFRLESMRPPSMTDMSGNFWGRWRLLVAIVPEHPDMEAWMCPKWLELARVGGGERSQYRTRIAMLSASGVRTAIRGAAASFFGLRAYPEG